MNIYFIRHADALPLDMQAITSDAERPLSNEGINQSQRLAAAFRQREIRIDQVLTSPLKRAMQTAEYFCTELGQPDLKPEVFEYLAPGEQARRLLKHLRRQSGENIALIGHEPDLGLYTAHLIGSKEAQIEFSKGGAACVACDQSPRKGTGVLLWLLTPKWLNS